MPHTPSPQHSVENAARRAIVIARTNSQPDNSPHSVGQLDTSASSPRTEAEVSPTEIELLLRGLFVSIVAVEPPPKASAISAHYLGEGKLKTLARLTGGPGVSHFSRAPNREPEDISIAPEVPPPEPIADLVVVDAELTPSQQRNLEQALAVEVWDRPRVILEIFERRARTREARLGVELARLKYQLPRIRDDHSIGDREGGGGRAARGHTNVELAKQRTRRRIQALEQELKTLRDVSANQRTRRRQSFRVALVGYTNAGKSSLMRALCGSDVFVEDQLFATLGTTTRQLDPPTAPPILVTDTVGFIKRLPHDLIASFRSTLDEVNEASLIVFVVDASDPEHEAQLAVARTVVGEVGADDIPHQLVLNKVDRLTEAERRELQARYPKGLLVSAKAAESVAHLRAAVIEFFDSQLVTAELKVPYAQTGGLSKFREQVQVLDTRFGRTQTVRVRGLPAAIAQLRRTFPK